MYTRFSTGETGNSIDLLVRYLGYNFKEAVEALTKKGKYMPVNIPPVPQPSGHNFVLPMPAERPYQRVYAYLLVQREIPRGTICHLMNNGLLYQEAVTGNAVFINRDRNFCELRGTCSYYEKGFHGIRRDRADRFWSVHRGPDTPQTAYICESAIDAVSLMVLHDMEGVCESSAYVSIGGVCNQAAIDLICASVHTVIAVDNDKAGQECRKRNSSLDYILPVHKDWNADLISIVRNKQK